MALHVCHFFLAKSTGAAGEYEDAFAFDLRERRFAMADGASEGSYSGDWATRLVKAFVASPPASPFPLSSVVPWLETLQEEMFKNIEWETLPWYAGRKASAGAFATLLGVQFERRTWRFPRGRVDHDNEWDCWRALALGDTCLFHVSGGAIRAAFPVRRSWDFSNHPDLVSSNPGYCGVREMRTQLRVLEGEWNCQDLLLLATDALAQWILAEDEADRRPWEVLSNVKSQTEFEQLVQRLRESGKIANDDTTMAVITERGNQA